MYIVFEPGKHAAAVSFTLVKSDPLPSDHVLLKMPVARCAGCAQMFVPGDVIAFLPIGPGSDKERRAACVAGAEYSAVSLPIHWGCATGM